MPEVRIACQACTGQHAVELTDEQCQPGQKFIFRCPDLDRRYRLMNFYVETRRNFFRADSPVGDNDDMLLGIKAELGEHEFDAKFERWKQIDYPTLGLIDEYPEKLSQIVNTFSIGHAYPAVTSACCLAERILNRLLLRCRHHFKSHPQYKRIHRKDSFDNWELMLDLIEEWSLIPVKAIAIFRELMPIRHESIHYNEGYNFDDIASDTINKLIAAVSEVFGVQNRTDLYLVFDVPGEVWVRSQAELFPFVKEFVIPHCYHAHAVHDVDFQAGIVNERLGKTGTLSDQEFVELRNAADKVSPPASVGGVD